MSLNTEFILRSPSLPLVSIKETLQPNELECIHVCLNSDVGTFTVQFDLDSDISEKELSALDGVVEATLLGETSDRVVYQLTVELEDSVSEAFATENINCAQLELATIGNNRWEEKKVFKDYEQFDQFRATCENHSISSELVSITSNLSTSDNRPQDGLTDRQREALTLALSRGYYESPRQATAEEPAKELGISQASLLGLLRRGERRLLTSSLGSEAQLHIHSN